MKKILLALALAFSFFATFLQSSESTKPVVTQEAVFTISCNFPYLSIGLGIHKKNLHYKII